MMWLIYIDRLDVSSIILQSNISHDYGTFHWLTDSIYSNGVNGHSITIQLGADSLGLKCVGTIGNDVDITYLIVEVTHYCNTTILSPNGAVIEVTITAEDKQLLQQMSNIGTNTHFHGVIRRCSGY